MEDILNKKGSNKNKVLKESYLPVEFENTIKSTNMEKMMMATADLVEGVQHPEED